MGACLHIKLTCVVSTYELTLSRKHPCEVFYPFYILPLEQSCTMLNTSITSPSMLANCMALHKLMP